MTAAAELDAAVPVRVVHRVVCEGCGWVGYRRDPWCRDCPVCGVDRSKVPPVWLAGCAPRAGLCCYLGHIWPPAAGLAGPPDSADPAGSWAGYRHACHYAGSTIDLRVRWPEHLAGGYDPTTHKATGDGARLLAAALYYGCTVELVRVWHGSQARRLEQRLKQRRKPDAESLRAGAARSLKPLCPLCNPTSWWRRYPNLPDPTPPPRPGRFIHDPQVWDADRAWDQAFPHLAYNPTLPAGATARRNPT
jgi:predicted GIY-YIG superfamily endonuclease